MQHRASVGVTAPRWSSAQDHPCILQVIEKKRIFRTFIKCVSFPPKQAVLVSLVLPVLACMPALAAVSPAVEILSCSSTIWLLELGSGPAKKVCEDAQGQIKL